MITVYLILEGLCILKKIQYSGSGRGGRGVKSLPSSSLEGILLSNQHAALHGDSIGTPLAVARIPHNQEAGRGLVGGVGC